MNIIIAINTDNEEFKDSMNGATIKILENICKKLRRYELDIHIGEVDLLRDSNGNVVGTFEVIR